MSGGSKRKILYYAVHSKQDLFLQANIDKLKSSTPTSSVDLSTDDADVFLLQHQSVTSDGWVVGDIARLSRVNLPQIGNAAGERKPAKVEPGWGIVSAAAFCLEPRSLVLAVEQRAKIGHEAIQKVLATACDDADLSLVKVRQKDIDEQLGRIRNRTTYVSYKEDIDATSSLDGRPSGAPRSIHELARSVGANQVKITFEGDALATSAVSSISEFFNVGANKKRRKSLRELVFKGIEVIDDEEHELVLNMISAFYTDVIQFADDESPPDDTQHRERIDIVVHSMKRSLQRFQRWS